jgi:hypothetical protein
MSDKNKELDYQVTNYKPVTRLEPVLFKLSYYKSIILNLVNFISILN